MGSLFQFNNSRKRLPLNKTSNIELFYDLVFVYCIGRINFVLTGAEEITWYTYYTFGFTFLLMLQIWVYSTIFMNRFGTGRTEDWAFLFINMFLLLTMTQSISVDWEYYVIYNAMWVLIIINFIVHWLVRLHVYEDVSKSDEKAVHITVGVLISQAIIVAASTLMPSIPGQIGCAIAVILGFCSWGMGPAYKVSRLNFEHISERCSLLVILTFGETLVGFANIQVNNNVTFGILNFILCAMLFVIYLTEFDKALDDKTSVNSIAYIAVTVWICFVIANITAGLELYIHGEAFLIPANRYLALSLAVYLLSFLLFIPFNKDRSLINKRWLIGRFIAAIVVVAPTFFTFSFEYTGTIIVLAGVAFALVQDLILHIRVELYKELMQRTNIVRRFKMNKRTITTSPKETPETNTEPTGSANE